MSVHVVVEAQRCHWRVKAIGAVPLHVPSLAVSVAPDCGAPEIVGLTVLIGGEGVAGAAFCTSIVSATIVKAWAAVSLPIWIVETPAVPRLCVADEYTCVALTLTSTV